MKKIALFIVLTTILFFSCSKGSEEKNIRIKEISTGALKNKVYIYYDEYQVPHIYAMNDGDLYWAFGYIEARDRLFQMELFRRLATGRLSELIGDIGGLITQLDWTMRAMNLTPEGKEVWDLMVEKSNPAIVDIINRFVSGINTYIDKIKAGKDVYYPVEFKYLKITPDFLDHWKARDVFAIDRLLTFFLSTTLDEEFLFSSWYVNLKGKDDDLLNELLNLRPVAKTPTLPYFSWNVSTSPFSETNSPSTGSLSSTPLKNFYRFLQIARQVLHLPFTGWASNNFVISGKKSATGHAFLANDPHLELLNPPILYELHLDSKSLPGATGTLNVEGLTFVGVPAIVIGHNEHLAWGGTFLGYDVTDLYAEKITIQNGKDYFYHNGNWYPIKHFSQIIKVRNYPSNTFSKTYADFPYIKWNDTNWHGPLFRLTNLPPTAGLILMTPSGMKGIANVAIKWTGMIPTDEAEAYIEINRSKTYEDFVRAARLIGVGGQNLVFADDKGNIGYTPFALVPIRQLSPGSKPWLIMDGTINNEWIGFVPLDELPQVTSKTDMEKYNERGFIATANNEQYGESYDNDPLNGKYYLMSDADIGFREERITQLLENGVKQNKIDLEYLKKVQTDDYSLVGEYFLKILREKYMNSQSVKNLINANNLQGVLNYLYNWSFYTPTGTSDPFGKSVTETEINDSVASTIFHAWIKRVVKNTLYDELNYYQVPAPFNEWGVKVLYYLLTATSTTDSPTYDPALGYSKLFDNISTPEVETPADILIESLKETVEFLSKSTGNPNPFYWRWGIFHKSLFIDPFIPYTRGPFPRDGGDFTVNVGKTDSSGTDFTNTHAPVTRFIVELNPHHITAINSLPGYNSDRFPQLEQYDQLPLWLHNKYREMHFYLPEVKKHVTEELILR